MVSFYYSKTFLTMPIKLLYFSVYELICKLCGNNNLIWKLQFRYVGLLAEVSNCLSIACYYCFHYFDGFCKHYFSLGLDFFFFVNQGGSLSPTVTVSFRIELESIFKVVLFRINTFLMTLVFTKDLSQSNISIAPLIRSVFASWLCQTS